MAAVSTPVASGPPWLLAGGASAPEREGYAAHLARFGACPPGVASFVGTLRESGLLGRGGARFPAWRKWQAVAERAKGRAVVLVNGAEGEPLSWKDRTLLERRPHLVLDGALLAAETIGAREIVVYLPGERAEACASVRGALAERSLGDGRLPAVRVVECPLRYVAGEESAAVSAAEGGRALPRFIPPRPFERGVGGAPTLVQNVETLAWAALIARFGAGWFRAAGTPAAPGPLLASVSGAVARPGVYEIAHGFPLAALVALAGGAVESASGVLVGGYFGTWIGAGEAAVATLDDASLREQGGRLGCGVVHVLPPGRCGVAETARILRYLAGESAQQCGPCTYGLPSVAELVSRIAVGSAALDDHARLQRWIDQLAPGRGACAHPDGAIGLLRSALRTFAADFDRHRTRRSCLATRRMRAASGR